MVVLCLALLLPSPLTAAAWTNPPTAAAPLPDWSVSGGDELSGYAAVGDFDGDGFVDIVWTRRGVIKSGGLEWQRFGREGLDPSGSGSLELPGFQAGRIVTFHLSPKDKTDRLLIHAADPAAARERGEWRLFSWRSNRLDWSQADWSFVPAARDERVGNAVAVGDFNGDGWNDLAVGTGDFPPRDNRPRRIDFFHGTGSGFKQRPTDSLVADQNDTSFASDLLAVDLDDDGRTELLVGSELWTSQVLHSGRIQTFSWQASGLKLRHTVEGDAGSLRMGHALTAGWNGITGHDGFVAVGLPGLDSLGVPGRVRLFQKRTGAVDLFEDDHLAGRPGNFGSGIALLDNARGLGAALIAVSSPKQSTTANGAGMVSIFTRPTSSAAFQPVWRIHGEGKAEGFGTRVIGGFDINHDGLGDLLIATRYAPGPDGRAGKLELVLGSSARWSTNLSWISPSTGGEWRVYDRAKPMPPIRTALVPGISLLPTASWQILKMPTAWSLAVCLLVSCYAFVIWRRRATMSPAEISSRARAQVLEDFRSQLSDDPSVKALLDQLEFKGSADAVWLSDSTNDGLSSVVQYLASIARQQMAPFRGSFELVLLERTGHSPSISIPATARQELLFICRELLNNVLKHSAASNSRMRLGLTEKGFLIEVVDNGTGFDPSTKFTGNGLSNLRSRTDRIGASLDIASAKNSGTTTTIVLRI